MSSPRAKEKWCAWSPSNPGSHGSVGGAINTPDFLVASTSMHRLSRAHGMRGHGCNSIRRGLPCRVVGSPSRLRASGCTCKGVHALLHSTFVHVLEYTLVIRDRYSCERAPHQGRARMRCAATTVSTQASYFVFSRSSALLALFDPFSFLACLLE